MAKEKKIYVPINENKHKIWITLIIILGVIILTIILSVTSLLNQKNSFEGTVECNSGNLGIDYHADYNNTLYLKESHTFLNGSNVEVYNYLEGGFVPKYFNLKGIDNLNCKINIKGEQSNIVTAIFLKALGN